MKEVIKRSQTTPHTLLETLSLHIVVAHPQSNLRQPGKHYFTCGVLGPGHCSGEMKFQVNVAAATRGGATMTTPSRTATSPPSSSKVSPTTPNTITTPIASTVSQ
ncbi:blue copper -like [Olea europaea subsp. europaea]|uniref:Blue copper -like n=1 Tax=Olea europaea subsp. europaea TaxID=158383 RepID=A0A8S0SRI6_OLEEU|nr:blue copper -like [Olea europaea subsp. europaea]